MPTVLIYVERASFLNVAFYVLSQSTVRNHAFTTPITIMCLQGFSPEFIVGAFSNDSLKSSVLIGKKSAFKCLFKSPAWIHVGCICFFAIMCPHCETILTSEGCGRRSWRNLKSLFTLYKQIPKNHYYICKNPGITYAKIPGFWSTENSGIPLGPDQETLAPTN